MGLRGTELIIILAVVLLLFGGKKIPELMKGIGKGVRSFRQGMQEAQDELNKPLDTTAGDGSEAVKKGKDRD